MQYLDRAKEIMDEFHKISELPVNLDDICFEVNPPQDRISGRRFFLLAEDFDRHGTVQFKIKCILGVIDDPKACVNLALINGNCGYMYGFFASALPGNPPSFVLAQRMVFAPSTSANEAAWIVWADLIDVIQRRYEAPKGVFLF